VDELDLFDQRLVLIDIEDDRSALSVLGQDQRTLGGANLLEEPLSRRYPAWGDSQVGITRIMY
jgi:hypothetical protein